MRREKTEVVGVVIRMNVEWNKKEGENGQKRWLDTIGSVMRTPNVCVKDMEDWDKWRSRTRVTNPK